MGRRARTLPGTRRESGLAVAAAVLRWPTRIVPDDGGPSDPSAVRTGRRGRPARATGRRALSCVVRCTFLVLLLCALAATGCRKKEASSPSAAPEASGPDKAALEARGKELYGQVCIACHGPQGEAKPNLGKDIGKSTFVHGLSDDELVAFLKRGRAPGDPMNTTGVAMPPKGGNPALTDDDLRAIVAYVRQLQALRYGK